MKILGIETATKAASVALIDETRLIAEYRLSLEQQHSEKLLPMIDILLKETQLSLSDISAIAVSTGPGSFTGLRIGLATAKGLAMGSPLPLLPVPTLEALAAPFCHGNIAVAPMILSRKEELYWTLFVPQETGSIRVFPDSVSSVDDALTQISSEKEVLFVGDGAVLFCERIEQRCIRPHFAPIGLQSPMASSVAALGMRLLLQGGGVSPDQVVPIYLTPFIPKTIKDHVK
jgi:tRNA threonylcarbamoyladenosine biosynthesis protein TsaB